MAAYKPLCMVSIFPFFFSLSLSLPSIHKEISRPEWVSPDQQSQNGRGDGFSTGKEGWGKCLFVSLIVQSSSPAVLIVLTSFYLLPAGMVGEDGRYGKGKSWNLSLVTFYNMLFSWWYWSINDVKNSVGLKLGAFTPNLFGVVQSNSLPISFGLLGLVWKLSIEV